MFCMNCGGEISGSAHECAACGTQSAPRPSVPAPPVPAARGARFGAYVIDVIPAAIVAFVLGLIPILGAMMAGFVLLCYWLFRDVAGSSLGKMLLGLRVVRKDGSPAEPKDRILRNLPLAAGPALLMIPVAGYVLAPLVAAPLVIIEAVLLLAKNERLGDMLAGTSVARS